MMNRKCTLVVSLAIVLLGLAVVTPAQERDLTDASMALARRGEGLIVARCAVCHSHDLVSQQRLPRDRWFVTVDKMKHWGAEISEEEADLLVRYLSARYHPGVSDQPVLADSERLQPESLKTGSETEGPLIGVSDRGAGLFEHNCQACHGFGAMGGMGPKLIQNPILKNEGAFWETVLYGRGPMPAWSSVLSHQDIADINAWLMSK